MASFRSKLQISVLLTSNQQPWHHLRSILYSEKAISDGCCSNYKKSIAALTNGKHQNAESRKCFSSCQGKSTEAKRKRIICKEQQLAERKTSLWERVFGSDPKKSSGTCRLTHCQRRQIREKDPRLRDPRYQTTAGDVLIYTEATRSLKTPRSLEPQPKPPPGFKAPTAVLLNRIMLEGFDRKDDNSENKKMTFSTFRKPYEEMRPPSDIKKQCREPEDIKSPIHEASTQMNMRADRDSTIKILRQAMEQDELEPRSRIEQLRLKVNERTSKSQCASLLSRISFKCKQLFDLRSKDANE